MIKLKDLIKESKITDIHKFYQYFKNDENFDGDDYQDVVHDPINKVNFLFIPVRGGGVLKYSKTEDDYSRINVDKWKNYNKSLK